MTPIIFIQAFIISGVLIFLPLFVWGKKSRKAEKGKGTYYSLLYFFSIGLGFMFVEISSIQRFILYLDHPVYALSTVIFSLLIASGAGSFVSQSFEVDDCRFWKRLLPLLSIIILLYTFFLPKFLEVFPGNTVIIRQVLTFAILFPLGFFMGMPFPFAIRYLEANNKDIIPWAWGVNGFSSVLSSILAVIVALSLGFSGVMYVAACAYLLAALAQRRFEGS